MTLRVPYMPGEDAEEAEEAEEDIRKALTGFLGVNFAAKTFLSERIEETLSGFAAAVAVNIFGNDLDQLDRKAQEIARVLERGRRREGCPARLPSRAAAADHSPAQG
jgi:Cu/Ag efflux pump CusA